MEPSSSSSTPTPIFAAASHLSRDAASSYIDAVREVGIEFRERTIGAFQMFSVVITLYQDKRRKHNEQRPKINNDAIVGGRGGPSSLLKHNAFMSPNKFFLSLHRNNRRPSSLLRLPSPDDDISKILEQMDNTTTNVSAASPSMTSSTTKFHQMTLQVHENTIGVIQQWINNQVQRHQERSQKKQKGPEPLLQEIIFDSTAYSDYPPVLENDCRDELFAPKPTLQISHFTPTAMMIEHNRAPLLRSSSSSSSSLSLSAPATTAVLGFNATAQRHDSFSLVYVLDDETHHWKTTHLPSMQPKRLSSSSSTTRPSTGSSSRRRSSTLFQSTKRMSQILLSTTAIVNA